MLLVILNTPAVLLLYKGSETFCVCILMIVPGIMPDWVALNKAKTYHEVLVA